MRRLILAVVAVACSVAGVLTGPVEAHAGAGGRPEWPSCVGVFVGHGLRVFVDPGTVVAGDVVEVRSGRTQLRQRGDGVWVGTVPARTGRDVHVVVKSGAARFSERRWSSWVTCTPVVPA